MFIHWYENYDYFDWCFFTNMRIMTSSIDVSSLVWELWLIRLMFLHWYENYDYFDWCFFTGMRIMTYSIDVCSLVWELWLIRLVMLVDCFSSFPLHWKLRLIPVAWQSITESEVAQASLTPYTGKETQNQVTSSNFRYISPTKYDQCESGVEVHFSIAAPSESFRNVLIWAATQLYH